MTFEGQYLTYAEFQAMGGSAIGQMPFNLLEFEARRQIDARTQNRLKNEVNIPQEVKICTFNLIKILQGYSLEVNKNIQSEKVGEYSVSYAGNISELLQGKDIEIDDIIINDLYGVIINNEHLIYVGVN